MRSEETCHGGVVGILPAASFSHSRSRRHPLRVGLVEFVRDSPVASGFLTCKQVDIERPCRKPAESFLSIVESSYGL